MGCTIAEWGAGRALADAKPLSSAVRRLILQWSKRCSFMRAVAEWLRLASAAGAPPVRLAAFYNHVGGA